MKRLIIAAAALSLLGGSAALAQNPNGDRDHDGIPNKYDSHDNRPAERRAEQRQVNRDVKRALGDRDHDGIPNVIDNHNNNRPAAYRPNGDRDHDGIPNKYDAQPNRYNYNGHAYDRFRGPVYYHPRGYTYRTWGRGQYLPRAYFANPYYVDNWSYYRLAPPPYGYRYIRVGNDIVLVANGNGLIANVIGGVFF